MKIQVTAANVAQVIGVAIQRTANDLVTFGEIALDVFGWTAAGGVVGRIVYENRNNIPNWHRIVNQGNHPVADIEALTRLIGEGYTLRNGCIV